MGIVLSLILIAVGAVLRFAVSADVQGWDLQTTGLILMIVGGLGVILSLVFWSSWGGFGRRTTVVDSAPTSERIVRSEREVH
jgi:hypothetical protein